LLELVLVLDYFILMIEDLVERITQAERLIRPYVRETPVVQSLALSEATGADVWLKCENLQVTGSFKARGATHRLLSLSDDVRGRGVVAASSGNHGVGVAYAGNALGIPVTVYVPDFVSPAKADGMRRLGARVVEFGTDGLDTEQEARRVADAHGQAYVSPYNDWSVVAGQGTVGVELERQLEDIGTVIVAVGGGGLIGGIGAYLKHRAPNVRVVGAQPANSNVMIESMRAGRVVEQPSLPTLSDGTAGGIELETVTFPLCRSVVDEWVEIEEASIADSIRHAVEVEHMLIEGSAGVAIAALSKCAPLARGRVVVVLCGANISAKRLGEALQDSRLEGSNKGPAF
jgi:threonine dehydratase